MCPQVNYRETITALATFDYTHKKQSGGSGQFGKVSGRIEPIPAAENGESTRMEFNNRLVGTDVPSVFVPSIEKGFLEAMASGNLTGHPVQVLGAHAACEICSVPRLGAARHRQWSSWHRGID